MQLNQTIDKLKDYDFLRTILANLPAVAFVIAPDGTVLFAEGKGIALAGLKREDVLGTNVSNYFSLYPGFEEKVRRVFEGETITSTVIAPNQRSLEVTYSPMRDDRGSICAVIGVAQDVTERIEREQALRERESWFRAIFESARDSIFIKDKSFRYVKVSPAMEQLFGLPASELVGKTDEDLFGPEAGAHLREVDARVLDVEVVEEENTKPVNGEPRSFHVIKAPMRDAAGIITGLCGIARDVTERKQKEGALRISEEALRSSFDASPVGIGLLINRKFQRVNKSLCRIMGYAEDDVLGQDTRLFYPDDEEYLRVGRELYGQMQREGVGVMEVRLRRKDGPIINVLLGLAPFNPEHLEDGVTATVLDITDRKRTEEALAGSEQKFRTLFESMQEGVAFHEVIYDDNGHPVNYRIIDVNPAYEKHTGIKPVMARGKLATDLYGTDSPPYLGRWAKVADTGEPNEFETYFEPMQKHFRISAVSPARGTFATVFLDITEQKRAEEEMRKLAAVVKHSKELVNLSTLDGKMIFLNETGMNTLGIEPQNIAEASILNVIPDHLMQLVKNELLPALMRGDTWQGDLQYRNQKTGALVDVYTTAFAVLDPSTRETQFFANVSQDITVRKRAEEEKERLQRQLQQSQKLEAIGTMAGGIAHDFNNILTGILGFTELVRSEIPEDTEVYKNLTEVVKAGRRARDLVKQILSFSRKAETEKSLISLVTIVKEALKLICSVTPSHISIKQNFTASPARAILADPTQMHQMVLNLCINAADAMPDGGVLEISLEEVQVETESRPEQTQLPSGCYLKLTVRDNGVGMPPEVQERIFEPYYTTKQVGKGTGMGLAVVHGVIKEHGGSIAVSSEPGKGTAFEIRLPIVEATPDAEIVSSPVVVAGSESILFVDDETMITNLQRLQLGKWGYCVTATESSATALSMFRANPKGFDLVITDLTMPGITGIKLAQVIHEISPSTPIILCTGFDEGISRENARTIGIHAILTKPISGAEFGRTIRMVLDEAFKPSPAKS